MVLRSLAALGVTITLGCGPARAPAGGWSEPPPGPATGSPPDSAQPAEACAASYGAVPVGAACTATAAACGFPEGRCWCGPRSYCGGAAPPRELLDELARPTWQCQPVRTDGCPESQPSGACPTDGQTCSYGDCCFVRLTCQAGQWAETGGGCPP